MSDMSDQHTCRKKTKIFASKLQWTHKPLVRQLAVASGVWASFFQMGLFFGSCPVLVAQLRREPFSDGTVIDDEKASWITSAGGFTGIPCVILLGVINEYFGRKPSCLFITVSSCASFAIFYCANSLKMLILSLILQGPLYGGLTNVCLMVATECVSPKYRGVCLNIKSATGFWAIWVANMIGTFFHWKNIGIIGVTCAIYNALMIVVCPESPYWLANKGKTRKCREAHRWFRGNDEKAEKDLANLIKSVMERPQKNENDNSFFNEILFFIKKISATQFYRPLLLCIILAITFQLSGKIVLSVYSIDIIKKITDSESAAYTGMLILDGFTVLGMYIGSFVSRHTRRRTLFFSTEFVAIFFLFALSLYLYLIKLDFIMENVYFSMSLLIAFSLSITCGPIILIYTFVGELLPLELRTFAGVVLCIVSNIVGGISCKLAPSIFSSLGTHGAFLYFAIGSLVCAFILYKYLPETKNKTLEEIEAFFKKKEDSKEIKELIPFAGPECGGCD